MSDEILDESSCSQVITKEIEIGLDPKFMGNEERAINRILENRKFKYNYEMKGILLNYSHLKFVTDYGRIIDDQAHIFWKISAKFTIFNVTVGQLIRGKINRLGDTYSGVLVSECIDATITYSEDVVKEELSPYLQIDQEIIFKVKSFDATHCFIDGFIDKNCFDKIKELIPLNDEFNGKDCNELKKRYEDCFNSWFADRFLRGVKEENCSLLFSLYQNCVKKAIKEQKIELWEIEKNVLGTDAEAKPPENKNKDQKKSKQ